MVEHPLTDAGRTGVVHLHGAQKRRVGRQNKEGRHGGEAGNEHVAVTGVGGGDAESRNDSRGDGLSRSSLRVKEHSGDEEHDCKQSRVSGHRGSSKRLDLVDVAGNERVTEPGNAQHAHAGNHTALEDGAVSDLTDFDLAQNRDQGADQEHQAHDGCVTRHDDGLDEAHGRRNRGGIQNHANNADQEDENGALGVGLELSLGFIRNSLHEPLGETVLVNRVAVEVHVGAKRHHEGRDHAADEGRHNPDPQESRIRPAEAFENAGHVDDGCGNRRRRNSDLGGNHGDRKRNDRADLLALGDFNDNRNHREGGVAGTGEDRQNIGDDRGEVVDVLRIAAQDPFGNLNEVVKAARKLHGGDGCDHRCDDQNHVPRNVTRLHAEAQTENQDAGAAGITDTDAAEAHTDIDCAQKHNNLKDDH